MNKHIVIVYILILLSFFSCEKESGFEGPVTHFGSSEYYAPFLFSSSDTSVLNKTLKFNFNEYAVEKKSSIRIKVVDTSENLIGNEFIRLLVNGKILSKNEFQINSIDSQKGNLDIGLKLLPGHPSGYRTGFFSVSNEDLDIVNDIVLKDTNGLSTSFDSRLFKWEVNYNLVMNPLKKGLIWFSVILIALLILWFIIFRNKIYPKFTKGKLQIVSPFFKSVLFGRKVKLIVFTDKPTSQKIVSRIFTGRIQYVINPIFTSEITFRPGRKNKIKIKLPPKVTISPLTNNLEKFKSYTIQIENEIIEIQYS